MHKRFYASGFLYHPRSQQILLQQQNFARPDATWSLFTGECKDKESSEAAFMRIVSKQLRLKLKPNSVYPVYNYSPEDNDRNNYIYYAKVRKLERFQNTKNELFAWFSFKQIQKLHMSEQMRQDIVVAQRVIASAIRKGLGQRTIE